MASCWWTTPLNDGCARDSLRSNIEFRGLVQVLSGHHLAVTEPARELREDAFEYFLTEVARTRVVDRTGSVRIALRSGAVLAGSSTSSRIEGHLDLIDSAGRRVLVSVGAVVMIQGSAASLRDESARTRSLASVLREVWSTRSRLRVLLRTGAWIDGTVVLVAADHVELGLPEGTSVLPFAAVDAWDLGPAQ